jgi:hypothetical protein
MISIQVIPKQDLDAYKLLRDKVTHGAATWYWANKAKSRLRHAQIKKGYIEVGSAEGVLVANIFRKEPRDLFYLSEKFMGDLLRGLARSSLRSTSSLFRRIEPPHCPRSPQNHVLHSETPETHGGGKTERALSTQRVTSESDPPLPRSSEERNHVD